MPFSLACGYVGSISRLPLSVSFRFCRSRQPSFPTRQCQCRAIAELSVKLKVRAADVAQDASVAALGDAYASVLNYLGGDQDKAREVFGKVLEMHRADIAAALYLPAD